MQTLGYINVDNKKIKVLLRMSKYNAHLKLRKTGEDGVHLKGEEYHLINESQNALQRLLNGESISI